MQCGDRRFESDTVHQSYRDNVGSGVRIPSGPLHIKTNLNGLLFTQYIFCIIKEETLIIIKNMKKRYSALSPVILSIIILVIVGVVIGIIYITPKKPSSHSQESVSTTSTINTSSSQYTGFMLMHKGDWSEVVAQYSSGRSAHQKAIYLGEETIKGIPTDRIELRGNTEDGSHFVVQLWIKKGTRFDIIKAASKGFKGDPNTYCVTKSMIERFVPNFESQVPSVGTPHQYQPTLPDISFGNYTTPTGKTVSVAKFKGDIGESWVSSTVPFGIVKMIDTTTNPPKDTMYLYDFGLANGQPELSDEEVNHCKTFPSLPF